MDGSADDGKTCVGRGEYGSDTLVVVFLYLVPLTLLMVIRGTAGGYLEVFKNWRGMLQKIKLCRR